MRRAITRGIINILPLAISLWLFWSVFIALENIGNSLILLLGYDEPIRGSGFLFVFGILLAAGFAFSISPVMWLYKKVESQLLRFPLFKPVYSAIKDMAELMSSDPKTAKTRQTVLIKQANDSYAVGFVTADYLPDSVDQALKKDNQDEQWVPVLMQLSYQVAGVTVLVKKSDLTYVDWPFEDAMRFMLTAGISQGRDKRI